MPKENHLHQSMDNKKQLKELDNRFTEIISTIVRSYDTKEKRVSALRNATPSDSSLLKVYETAKGIEDYETCEAVNELLIERGIKI